MLALAAITKDDGLKSLSVLYKVAFSPSIVFYAFVLDLWTSALFMIFLVQLAETCGHAGGQETFACCIAIPGMHSTDSNASF